MDTARIATRRVTRLISSSSGLGCRFARCVSSAMRPSSVPIPVTVTRASPVSATT